MEILNIRGCSLNETGKFKCDVWGNFVLHNVRKTLPGVVVEAGVIAAFNRGIESFPVFYTVLCCAGLCCNIH